MSETVMIVAGETSGELYGSLLAEALKKKVPGVRVVGIGGERMKAAGVELLSGIASAFGIAEALSSIKALKETFRKASEALRTCRPSVIVLIDYPDFNLRLAAEARKLNIPVLYYVSPQVWAWRRGRVKKIAGLVDRMAVILPFEAEIYRDTGLDAEFVGHPVLDEIRGMKADKQGHKAELGLVPGVPLISLLPGSRPHELERLLPLVLETVRACKRSFPGFQFCIPFAPNTDLVQHLQMVDMLKAEGVSINRGKSLATLAASDYAVIASGTATLQAVLLGVPLVVMYKLFPLTFWLGKRVVKVKWVSLVNILSDREVVRELLQKDATVENVLQELGRIMNDAAYRQQMLAAYGDVQKVFAGKHASARVADMIVNMAGWER
ncbi:MAG TPA: lipid-A-disaccharide synthase [Thermodesulfovibrionales bacterium]|nr:lipid-A-disaccharide synthase [Thermodesulfovibrionales bacterium]